VKATSELDVQDEQAIPASSTTSKISAQTLGRGKSADSRVSDESHISHFKRISQELVLYNTASRQTTFFVEGTGIDREVITTDICRYLGNDALVRPGEYRDKTGRLQQGYHITAYRTLTSAQLHDIRSDSAKWQEEKRRIFGRSRVSNRVERDAEDSIKGEERTPLSLLESLASYEHPPPSSNTPISNDHFASLLQAAAEKPRHTEPASEGISRHWATQ
jgi:hypothetical protein